jgi:hypothetical protein
VSCCWLRSRFHPLSKRSYHNLRLHSRFHSATRRTLRLGSNVPIAMSFRSLALKRDFRRKLCAWAATLRSRRTAHRLKSLRNSRSQRPEFLGPGFTLCRITFGFPTHCTSRTRNSNVIPAMGQSLPVRRSSRKSQQIWLVVSIVMPSTTLRKGVTHATVPGSSSTRVQSAQTHFENNLEIAWNFRNGSSQWPRHRRRSALLAGSGSSSAKVRSSWMERSIGVATSRISSSTSSG